MKTFISLSITLTGYYVASGQFDLQYCGVQQHLNLFQEIWSAWHDSVLSGGGYDMRFKAVGNKNLAWDSKAMGSLQVEDEMKRNMLLWDVSMWFSNNYNLNTTEQELEFRRGLMLPLSQLIAEVWNGFAEGSDAYMEAAVLEPT